MVEPKILLLGVGNTLYKDEGVGVHAANYLEEHYNFSPNVTLMEGGILGKLLMPYLMEADIVLIMDAVLGGEKPGTMYRFEDDALRKSLGFNDSQHQVDLVDILIFCEMVGSRPRAVIIGIEPEDFKTMDLELTKTVQDRFLTFIDKTLVELETLGGSATKKDA